MQDDQRTKANFAVIAARRIAEGDAHDAVRLCAEGIAVFPEYLGGYIVLAQAYDVLQRYDDAYIMRTEAHRRFPWLPWVGPLADSSAVVEVHATDVTEETTTQATEPTLVPEPAEPVAEPEPAELVAEPEPAEPVTESEPLVPVVQPTAAESALIEVRSEPTSTDDLHTQVSDAPPVVLPSADQIPVASEEVTTTAIDVTAAPTAYARVDHVETLHTLRLIQTATPVDDKRIIRSAAVRLIPGLEFTSLRFEGVKQRGRRPIQRLLDPPPFREFHAPVRRRTPAVAPPTSTEQPTRKRPFSLEELAQRLERARLPRPESGPTLAPKPTPEPRPTTEPSRAAAPVVFSETMARIYEAQGSFELALDVYRALQQQQPERSDHFQSLIDAIIAKRGT